MYYITSILNYFKTVQVKCSLKYKQVLDIILFLDVVLVLC